VRYRCYESDLAEIDKIIVDGNECGLGVQLSHWPGNTTPKHLRADLSVEIALRCASDPHRRELLGDRDLVTNDHYDTDGLLAAWAVLHPVQALTHASELVATAETGDFYEFSTPAALQLDLTIQAFHDRERSPLAAEFAGRSDRDIEQRASDAILSELPGLLYDTSRYRELWAEDYATIVERLSWLNQGYVHTREYPTARLTVLDTQRPLDHFSRNAFSRGHRILEAHPGNGGTFYTLYYREFLWYDIVSRSTSPRHQLTPVADRLNELEPSSTSGAWVVTSWTPALLFAANGDRTTRTVTYKEPTGQSALAPADVTQLIIDQLHHLDNPR
jgi:hypothetical protein